MQQPRMQPFFLGIKQCLKTLSKHDYGDIHTQPSMLTSCLVNVLFQEIIIHAPPMEGFFGWNPLPHIIPLEIPVVVHAFLKKKLAFETPPPWNFQKTPLGWEWIFSGTTHLNWSFYRKSLNKKSIMYCVCVHFLEFLCCCLICHKLVLQFPVHIKEFKTAQS